MRLLSRRGVAASGEKIRNVMSFDAIRARTEHRKGSAAALNRLMPKDVVACFHDAGLDIAEEVKSKRELKLVQEQFNAWAKETGLPYTHLSRICAFSIGENYEAH